MTGEYNAEEEQVVCLNCGAVESIHIYHNTETDEITRECEECGEVYEILDGKDSIRASGPGIVFGEGGTHDVAE